MVPQYVERPQVVVRSGANEVVVMENDRWAEDLGVAASRTLADDLAAQLPSDEVLTLPSQLGLPIDYEVRIDLTRFDIAADGKTAIVGRWSIIDATDGSARASGRVTHAEQATEPGFAAVAAAISQNLYALSTDIADAAGNLSARKATGR